MNENKSFFELYQNNFKDFFPNFQIIILLWKVYVNENINYFTGNKKFGSVDMKTNELIE